MSRDTQFAGWAKAVVERVTGLDEWDTDDLERILARAAYDLACHVASFTTEREALMMRNGLHSPSQALQDIPDMSMLPRDL